MSGFRVSANRGIARPATLDPRPSSFQRLFDCREDWESAEPVLLHHVAVDLERHTGRGLRAQLTHADAADDWVLVRVEIEGSPVPREAKALVELLRGKPGAGADVDAGLIARRCDRLVPEVRVTDDLFAICAWGDAFEVEPDRCASRIATRLRLCRRARAVLLSLVVSRLPPGRAVTLDVLHDHEPEACGRDRGDFPWR